MRLDIAATTDRPPLRTTTVEQLPSTLPNVKFVPASSTEHPVPNAWVDWKLATLVARDGFDPRTGKELFRRTEVFHYGGPEHRSFLRLDAKTPFATVIAIAQARSGFDRTNAVGEPQAVLQATTGEWYLTSAGYHESDDHDEPLGVDWPASIEVRQHVRDLKAIVGERHWVNFTDAKL